MVKLIVLLILSVYSLDAFAATDSYRWLHVTIETPWFIFIFLLPMVLLPAILMAIMYWRFAGKKKKTEASSVLNTVATEDKLEKQE